ncbi:hypothetical protein K469DRAFT_746598 [Zopfia rhizophila CBS 207.26]|uniref:CorA-like transporter domain-containing protein n=1 Tax=Zopfia rhizophila CBS 207.26 TaxID=1314779 RepID=A0A6A6EID5_9PEZI|nr:hypothetical protein K469DRAFT_746598 [Zopfia rhizophila CBS 207.26]
MASNASDWQNYPSSLSVQDCDPYIYDTNHFAKLLKNNNWIFRDMEALQNYLKTSEFMGTRIILIPQRFSWDQLLISEKALRRLLHHFKVFPVFLDVLCAFGRQTSSTSDSLGGYHSQTNGTKSVEEHGREESQEPWSIRQMCIYHQQDKSFDNNNFIIINLTKSFQHRLKDARAHTTNPPTWREIHTLAVSYSTWHWRWYLGFWESKLSQLISKAHLSQVETSREKKHKPVLTIQYSDVQDVQVIYDRMNMVKFILGSNVRICNKLRNDFGNESLMEIVSTTDLFREELEMQLIRADNLLERTKSGSALMQDIISFRGLDTLKISNDNSNEMARLADIDNKNMIELTKKSQREAQTLKKITILTMVYLPASFVSQFLSMGYLTVNSSNQPPSLHFASEMWIFAALTFILLTVTLGMWVYIDYPKSWWHRWRKPRNLVEHEKV